MPAKWVKDMYKEKEEGKRKKDEEIKTLQTKFPKHGMIYEIFNKTTKEMLYIGKSDNFNDARINQHLEKRSKIIDYQQIDIQLALLDLTEIEFIKLPFDYYEEVEILREEKQLISKYSPRLNIAEKNKKYVCPCCGKDYIRRFYYEAHRKICAINPI